MKRTIAALLSAALLLSLLPACRSGGVPSPAPSGTGAPSAPADPSAAVSPSGETQSASGLASLACGASGGGDLENLERHDTSGDGEWLSAYIENAYALQDPWEDAAVLRATGASSFEIAVLRMADEDAAAHAADTLKGYLTAREGDFSGYAPDQAKLAADGEIRQSGAYVGLFICPKAGDAAAAFAQGLGGEEPAPTPAVSVIDEKLAELMDEALNYCGEQGEDVSQMELLDYRDPAALKDYVTGVYGVSGEMWDTCLGGIVAKGPEGSVFQAAIFRMGTDTPEKAGKALGSALHVYLDGIEERNEDPAQAEMLHEVRAFYIMKHCFLIVSSCYEGAMFHLADCLNAVSGSLPARHWTKPDAVPTPTPDLPQDSNYPNRVEFNPPNEEDMSIYDTSAIRAAWDQGDPSALSEYDRAVYDSAERVLNEVLTDGMSDLEKETAIYRWLVDNVDYDWRHQDIMAQTPRSAYEPYGGLVDRMAVCLGYAASFQLLCDLAGVECITVVGAAFENDGDHAWNMVRLDGAWYCVDVTWDANGREQLGGRYGQWRYFNITSDQMADTNHQWDYANTPEAVTEGQGLG